MRTVLLALDKARRNGFDRAHVLMDDFKEVVQAMKGERDWSINPIILDTKAVDSLFCFTDFDYILMTLNR